MVESLRPIYLCCSVLLCAVLVLASPSRAEPAGRAVAQSTSSARPTAAVAGIRDKWALIVGISNFKNSSYNLKYAAKDALDFRNFLVNEANFAPDHVKLLIDEQASEKAIKSAFGDKFLPRVSMPGDLVVIFVSTHGTPSTTDQGGEYYLMAWDSDAEDLYATGVNMKDLADRIKRAVKTDRALIVMDTCYSGGAAGGGKGMARVGNVDASQLEIGKGHRVISSSSHDERSYESSRYPNGVFTHYLIEGLRQNGGKADIQKAFDYMKSKVQWEVQSDRGASQNPRIAGDWSGQELVLSALPAEKRTVSPELTAAVAEPPRTPSGGGPGKQQSTPPAANNDSLSTPSAVPYPPQNPYSPPAATAPVMQPPQGMNPLVDSRLVGTWEGTLSTLEDSFRIVLQVLPDGQFESLSVGSKGTQYPNKGYARMVGGKWVSQAYDGYMDGGTYVVTNANEFILLSSQGPIIYKRKR